MSELTAQRYRKKPIVIAAMQTDGTLDTANAIIDWAASTGGRIFAARFHAERGSCDEMTVLTPEGQMRADEGDWIIRGVKGEFYPCKPDIFDATYDPE